MKVQQRKKKIHENNFEVNLLSQRIILCEISPLDFTILYLIYGSTISLLYIKHFITFISLFILYIVLLSPFSVNT